MSLYSPLSLKKCIYILLMYIRNSKYVLKEGNVKHNVEMLSINTCQVTKHVHCILLVFPSVSNRAVLYPLIGTKA